MRTRMLVTFLGLASLLLVGAADPIADIGDIRSGDLHGGSTGGDEATSYIVELRAAPGALAEASAVRGGQDLDVDAYRAELEAAQDALLADLASDGVEVEVQTVEAESVDGRRLTREARFTYVLNAVGVRTSPAGAAAIAEHPDVEAVHVDEPVEAHMDESVDYTNAPQVWEDPGATGAGQAIAVLDTGVDWTHPMFGADPTPPNENHPKVTRYETFTAGHHDGYGHGTHVAGTAAGTTQFGDDPLLGEARYDGPAKDAEIWAYKVLSDAGTGLTQSVVMGIEHAAENSADVINLSLGSTNGDPEAISSQAVNAAAAVGTVSATSAGNSGPGYSTIGSPASAHDAVSVGASTDPGDFAYFAHLPEVDDPTVQDMEIIPLSGAPIPETNQTELYVDCGLALTPADCGTDAMGRIALIERGGTPFTAKAASAEAAGAIAAIIYNDQPGNFAGTLIAVEPSIPVAAMSQEHGHALLEHVDGGVSTEELLLAWDDPHSIVGQVTGFSSRGPNDDFVIKPDVVAPGNNITAPVPRVGQLASPDGYADAGGTSMSAPHVSGILAQLSELHPDWTPQMLKTALMNTAAQLVDPATGDRYSVHDQGAGLVDAHAAATTPALLGEAYEGHAVYEDGELARGSVSFGLAHLDLDEQVTLERQLTLIDVSGEGGTWRLGFEPAATHDRHGAGRDLPADGFDLRFADEEVVVEPDGTVNVGVALDLDSSLLETGDYEGRIVATDGERTLRVPVGVRVESKVGAERIEALELHMRGNVEDDCTGDGRADMEVCGGPFLRADADLSAAAPARWVGEFNVLFAPSDRMPEVPNWILHADAHDDQLTVHGPVTLRWWTVCGACDEEALPDDWDIRVFVDGHLITEERVEGVTAESVLVPSLLEATVDIDRVVTVHEDLVVHIDPVFTDSSLTSVILYDAQQGCGADGSEPCDSTVTLPVVTDPPTDPDPDPDPADLRVTEIETENPEQRGGPPGDREPATITATVDNVGDDDADAFDVLFEVFDEDGELDHEETVTVEDGLEAESDVDVTSEWELPQGRGEYTIVVTADPDGAAHSMARTVTVRGGQIVEDDDDGGDPPGQDRDRDRDDGGDTTGPSQVAGAADADTAMRASERHAVTGLATALLILALSLHVHRARCRSGR